MLSLAMSAGLILRPLGYVLGSSSALTFSPALVVVAGMRLTMTWCVMSGLPRQFLVMNENRRCSILFHLLLRLPLRPELLTAVFEVADQFLLLRVDRNRRISRGDCLF